MRGAKFESCCASAGWTCFHMSEGPATEAKNPDPRSSGEAEAFCRVSTARGEDGKGGPLPYGAVSPLSLHRSAEAPGSSRGMSAMAWAA